MNDHINILSMNHNGIHPKPKYEIFGFDNGISKPDPDIVKKRPNRQVRLPYFEQKQNMHSIDLILDIEGVGNHPKNKLIASFTPRGLHFTVEDLEGEDVHLIIPRLAHEINPSQSYVTIKNKNAVVITLMKIKPQIWKTVFYNTDLVKKLWAQSMREFVQTIIDQEDVASVLKEIWNQAQIICTDDINFFLNAPTPFGPIPSLQGATTIDHVIERLKVNITNRNDIFVKAFFLGAAVLYKLQRDHDDEFKEVDQNSGNESESASSNLDDENISSLDSRLKKISLMNISERKAFANRKKELGNKHLRTKRYTIAIKYYSEAIDLYPETPVFYSNRSTCHFILKNYDESFEDACKAIDLDPLFDKGFYRAHKALVALELPTLATKVAHLALEFDQENRSYFNRLMADDYLPSSESGEEDTETYIKCDLRLKQMENFEKIRSINREFEEKKNYEKVQIMARELLETSKAATVACGYYFLSYCAYHLNEEESALKYIDKCLKLNGDHAPAKRLDDIISNFFSTKENGFITFVEGKFADCISWYKKGLLEVLGNPNHVAQFWFLMGMARKAQNKVKEAVKNFSQAVNLRKDYPYSYLMRGECYHILGMAQEAQVNFSKAVDLYKKELNKSPTLTEVNANIKGSNNNKTFNKLKSEISERYQTLADAYFEKSNFYAALENYRLYVMCHPTNAEAHWKCALAYRKLHRVDAALRLASKAIDLNPELGNAHLEKARCLIILGYVERAIDCLERAQTILSSDEVKADMSKALTLRVFLKRGNDAMAMEDYDAAEMYLTEAKKIAHLDLDLQIKLIQCRGQLKKLKNAPPPAPPSTTTSTQMTTTTTTTVVTTTTSTDAMPNGPLKAPEPEGVVPDNFDFADHYCIMGAFAYHQGNKEEALSNFNKALEHDPNHEKAKEAFDLVQQVFSVFDQACDYLSQDRLKDAQSFFQMGSVMDDDNSYMKAKMHYGLGLTYYKMGEYEKALAEFSSSISNDCGFADAYLKRGECYQTLENYSKAIEDFKLAIVLDPAPEYKDILKKAQKKLLKQTI